MTLSGGITLFPIPSGNEPGSITAAPDGNLWFAEPLSSFIGRITPQGVVTEFKVVQCCQVRDITLGPDGALWFTVQSNPVDEIGRITLAGVVTLYPIMTGARGPGSIAAGPDGALWFTEDFLKRIGRITTDGHISDFTLPAGGIPSGITTGPDGAVWFGRVFPDAIDKITTAGQVTEFPVPNTAPQRIITGPDGNLWFVTAVPTTPFLARFSTAGTLTKFFLPLSDGANVFGITVGPDGAIWFAEQSDQIGRIEVPQVVAVPMLSFGFACILGLALAVAGTILLMR